MRCFKDTTPRRCKLSTSSHRASFKAIDGSCRLLSADMMLVANRVIPLISIEITQTFDQARLRCSIAKERQTKAF